MTCVRAAVQLLGFALVGFQCLGTPAPPTLLWRVTQYGDYFDGLYVADGALWRHVKWSQLTIQTTYVMHKGLKQREWVLVNRTEVLFRAKDPLTDEPWMPVVGSEPGPVVASISQTACEPGPSLDPMVVASLGMALTKAGDLVAAKACLMLLEQGSHGDNAKVELKDGGVDSRSTLLALGSIEKALGNTGAAMELYDRAGCQGTLMKARLFLQRSWELDASLTMYATAISQCNGGGRRTALLERAIVSVLAGNLDTGIAHYDQARLGDYDGSQGLPDMKESVASLRDGLLPGLQGIVELASRYLPHLSDNCTSASEVHRAFAPQLLDLGAVSEAQRHLQGALTIWPFAELDDTHLAWAVQQRLHALAPLVCNSREEINSLRRRLVDELDDMRRLLLNPSSSTTTTISRPEANLGIRHRFLLIYQGLIDLPVLQKEEELFRGIAPTLTWQAGEHQNSSSAAHRVRVGFLSAHWRWHSVGRLLGGVIQGLTRNHTDLHVHVIYPEGSERHSSSQEDEIWGKMRSCEGLTLVPVARDLRVAQETIAGLGLEVLVFGDIGMEALTSHLAYARLAPTQVAFWGHPSTSGLSTMDYFITSELYEDDSWDAQDRFSEQLVRFSSLSTLFGRPPSPPPLSAVSAPLRDLLLRRQEGRRFYVCAQMLHKLHPSFDQAIQGILAADHNGTVILLRDGNRPLWQRMLENRLRQNLGEGYYARVLFLDLMPYPAYMALQCHVADVALDPFPFGGGVTMLEAVSCATPFVTLGREQTTPQLAAGIAKRLGLEDHLVAGNPTDYVAKAVELGQQGREPRNAVLEALEVNAHKVLYDVDSVSEWAGFLERMVDR